MAQTRSDTSTRSWYRLHLTTAFALLVIGAALLWANVRLREASEPAQPDGALTQRDYGWPWRAYSSGDSLGAWHFSEVAGNALTAAAILFFNAAYFESRVRNRERVWELKRATRARTKTSCDSSHDSGLG